MKSEEPVLESQITQNDSAVFINSLCPGLGFLGIVGI